MLNEHIKIYSSMTTYEGSKAIAIEKQAIEWNKTKYEFKEYDCEMTLNYEKDENQSVLKGSLTFEFNKEVKDIAVALVVEDESWEEKNYVLIPAAVYNGNRFKSYKIAYPPYVDEQYGADPDMPTTITDVPRLNNEPGESKIQLTTGDAATPCMAYFSEHNKQAVYLLTKHKTRVGYSGLFIEENEARNKATLKISAPAVREEYKYSFADMETPSDDGGATFKAGENIELAFELHIKHCESVEEFYEYFSEIRENMETGILRNYMPLGEGFRLIEEQYNREHFEEENQYYRCGTQDVIYQYWQSGWVGGGINTYPLLCKGNPESYERALKTFDFVIDKVQHPSGWYYGIYCKGKTLGDNFAATEKDEILLTRKNADMLYFLIKQYAFLKDNHKENIGKYEDSIKKCCNAFVRFWRKNGQFGQFIDIDKEEVLVGETASAGLAVGALALAYQILGNEEYLLVAEEAAAHYYEKFVSVGITNGGPGEIAQGPDSESAFALLESYITLYEITRTTKWLEIAKSMADQCMSWCVSYDFEFPKNSTFEKLDIKCKGSVFANVQNKHSAPGICTLSGNSLLRLYRATGEKKYIYLLRDIAHNITQYISTKERPIKTLEGCYLNEGYMNERVNMSDWEGKDAIGGVWNGANWPDVSCMLTYLEVPGIYMNKDTLELIVFDHVECEIIDEGKAIKVTNPTKYDCQVNILAETEIMTAQVLPINYFNKYQRIALKAQETKVIDIE